MSALAAPNGKPWSNTGIWFLRIAEGRIIEIEWLFDDLNLMRQLGGEVVPMVNAETKEPGGSHYLIREF